MTDAPATGSRLCPCESAWLNREECPDRDCPDFDRLHPASASASVGDRIQIMADGYSEPKGSYATVTEIHPDHGDVLTVRWEHLNGTCSLPIWQEHVEVVG